MMNDFSQLSGSFCHQREAGSLILGTLLSSSESFAAVFAPFASSLCSAACFYFKVLNCSMMIRSQKAQTSQPFFSPHKGSLSVEGRRPYLSIYIAENCSQRLSLPSSVNSLICLRSVTWSAGPVARIRHMPACGCPSFRSTSSRDVFWLAAASTAILLCCRWLVTWTEVHVRTRGD